MKTKRKLILMLIIVLSLTTQAQVAINTDGTDADASAMLDIKSDTSGILIPRMTQTQRGAISNPATGLLVYQTDGTAGFYYNSGTPATPAWIGLSSTLIAEIADADGDTKVQVEATADEDTIRFVVAGTEAMTIDNSGNIGIGTTSPDASALLELNSTTKGLLPPRMCTSEMNAIASPVAGLMVYNTSLNTAFLYDGSVWWKMYNNDGESCGTISYDGQTYQTVVIGMQCWMAENLNIGTGIVGSSNQTNNGTIEKYCYDDNIGNCDTYGGLYQWNEMMQYVNTEGTQGICPPDWHLPTDAEWKTMEMHLGMSLTQADNIGYRGTDEGGKLKEAGTAHWWSPNTGTNSSGFTALPEGYLNINGTFNYLGCYGYGWSSSEYSGTYAWHRYLYYNNVQVGRYYDYKTNGYSVRCLKD